MSSNSRAYSWLFKSLLLLIHKRNIQTIKIDYIRIVNIPEKYIKEKRYQAILTFLYLFQLQAYQIDQQWRHQKWKIWKAQKRISYFQWYFVSFIYPQRPQRHSISPKKISKFNYFQEKRQNLFAPSIVPLSKSFSTNASFVCFVNLPRKGFEASIFEL